MASGAAESRCSKGLTKTKTCSFPLLAMLCCVWASFSVHTSFSWQNRCPGLQPCIIFSQQPHDKEGFPSVLFIPTPVSITGEKPFLCQCLSESHRMQKLCFLRGKSGCWNQKMEPKACLLPKVKIKEFDPNSVKDIERKREVKIKYLLP